MATQCCSTHPPLNARVDAITDVLLKQLIAAGPNDPIDIWTIQSEAAVAVLKSGRDLIANDAAVFPVNSTSASCASKRHAYCWIRKQMMADFAQRQQTYDGVWPIWAWVTVPQVSKSDERVLHLHVPRRYILFSWHSLWERLLQCMLDIEYGGDITLGCSAYFAIDQHDLDATCPNSRVPPADVCKTSWPRMFCLGLGNSPLYRNARILQATIPRIYCSQSIVLDGA